MSHVYTFMNKINSCKSHFNAPDTVMSTQHVKIHARKKALTMVHPLDEPVDPKPVDPFDVPTKDPLSEESQME